MKNLIQKISKESKQNDLYIEKLFDEIHDNLIREGCEEDDPRFQQYLLRRIRKKLKIKESKVYSSFKDFFKEK